MSHPVDHVNVTIECPNCGSSTKKPLGWIRTHNPLICSCGADVSLSPEQISAETEKAERSIAALQGTIKVSGDRNRQ